MLYAISKKSSLPLVLVNTKFLLALQRILIAYVGQIISFYHDDIYDLVTDQELLATD